MNRQQLMLKNIFYPKVSSNHDSLQSESLKQNTLTYLSKTTAQEAKIESSFSFIVFTLVDVCLLQTDSLHSTCPWSPERQTAPFFVN